MSTAEPLAALSVRDIQGGEDHRGVTIDRVGIDQLSYPIEIGDRDGSSQATVAAVSMGVELIHHSRGVHMSRFVEVLDAYASKIGQTTIRDMADETRTRLGSERSHIEFSFPYFVRRPAPASGIYSMSRYECRLRAESAEGSPTELEVGVRVPVTSLCPCSKEISDYGAHNQRGYVEIAITSPWPAGTASGIWFEDLLEIAEDAGSAPIHPLLKRSDERLVTMQAYDNPVFVEDIVRDIAVVLREDIRVRSARVSASNQESIHDHNAVAQLHWERADG